MDWVGTPASGRVNARPLGAGLGRDGRGGRPIALSVRVSPTPASLHRSTGAIGAGKRPLSGRRYRQATDTAR